MPHGASQRPLQVEHAHCGLALVDRRRRGDEQLAAARHDGGRLQQRALSKAEELRKAGAVEGNHAVVLTITDVEPRADAAEALGRSERVARCLREMLARCCEIGTEEDGESESRYLCTEPLRSDTNMLCPQNRDRRPHTFFTRRK